MAAVSVNSLNAADVVGQRVIIRAVRRFGSVRVLNGLTGTIVAPHPFVTSWVKVRLDPNPVTPHEVWAMPRDRLFVNDSA